MKFFKAGTGDGSVGRPQQLHLVRETERPSESVRTAASGLQSRCTMAKSPAPMGRAGPRFKSPKSPAGKNAKSKGKGQGGGAGGKGKGGGKAAMKIPQKKKGEADGDVYDLEEEELTEKQRNASAPPKTCPSLSSGGCTSPGPFAFLHHYASQQIPPPRRPCLAGPGPTI